MAACVRRCVRALLSLCDPGLVSALWCDGVVEFGPVDVLVAWLDDLLAIVSRCFAQ